MNHKNIALLIVALFSVWFGFSQNVKDIIIGEEFTLFSKTLNQERSILIHKPKSYNDTIYSPKDYPILILLDAQEHFELTTGIVNFMSTRLDSKLIPELLIVGIKSENRVKDFTPSNSMQNPEGVYVDAFKKSGNAKKFLSFIEFELIPKILKDYRASSYKILVGHSLGGLITVFDFISDDSLFDAHISMDPSLWWDNGLLTKMVQSPNYGQGPNTLRKLYISGAHNSSSSIDTTAMRTNQEKFYNAIRAKVQIEPNVKFEVYENEDHGTVPLPSIYKGLQFIFEDYKMKDMLGAKADEIQKHFENISPSIGLKLHPEERVIDILGNYFLEGGNDKEKAISFFEMNVLNYESSYHAYYALANAKSKNGQLSEAITNYKKSLELKPKNKKAIEELKEVLEDNR